MRRVIRESIFLFQHEFSGASIDAQMPQMYQTAARSRLPMATNGYQWLLLPFCFCSGWANEMPYSFSQSRWKMISNELFRGFVSQEPGDGSKNGLGFDFAISVGLG